MKRTSIAYTDSISGLASLTYLVATPGETKTMTAEYTLGGTCITLDNTVVQYDSAIALTNPRFPASSNYFRFTVTSATVVGTWYDMTLLVNGSSQGADYWFNKNMDVQFKRLSDNTFSIRHRFMVTDDVNGYVAENGTNNYNLWFSVPDGQAPTISTIGSGSSMYDSDKFFVKHIRVTDITTQTFDEMLDFDVIDATYYDQSPLVSTFAVTLPTLDYVIGVSTPTRITFTNVNALNTPTSAKILMINGQPTNTVVGINPAIIEDNQTATVINVAGNTWRLDANLTALSEFPKEIIAIVYYNALNSVASSKIGTFPPRPNGPITAIRGCYPTITTTYNDYNNVSIGSCIKSALFERIEPIFSISKTSFVKIGGGIGCFPLGFDQYNKTGTFELKQRSTGEVLFTENFSYNASSTIWNTGSLTFTDAGGFLNFSYIYRNLIGYLGDNIDATLTFNIWYSSTYYETVVSQSANFVANFSQSGSLYALPYVEELKVYDSTNTTLIDSMVGNLMTIAPTCDNIFKVRVKRSALTMTFDCTVIPFLYEIGSSAISEENSYTGTPGFGVLSGPYFSSVPTSFGLLNDTVTFDLDMSSLDKTRLWQIAVIVKKV
jgi:hypothetical protein